MPLKWERNVKTEAALVVKAERTKTVSTRAFEVLVGPSSMSQKRTPKEAVIDTGATAPFVGLRRWKGMPKSPSPTGDTRQAKTTISSKSVTFGDGVKKRF